MTITQQRLTDQLDRLEDSLPDIPSKTVAFGRAMARRTTDTACTIIGDISDRADNVGSSIATASRTAIGQTRSAAERSISTIRSGIAEATGQTRAQTEAVIDTIDDEANDLLDTATTAVEPRTQRPSSLDELSKTELYERAQRREVAGRSTMSRDELIRALRTR